MFWDLWLLYGSAAVKGFAWGFGAQLVFKSPGNTINKASHCQASRLLRPSGGLSGCSSSLPPGLLAYYTSFKSFCPGLRCSSVVSIIEFGPFCAVKRCLYLCGSSESHSPLLHLIFLLLAQHCSCFLGNLGGSAAFSDQALGTRSHPKFNSSWCCLHNPQVFPD